MSNPSKSALFLSSKNIRLFANPLYLMTFPFFCMSALGRNVNEIKKKNNNRADVRQHTPKHTWTNTCTYRRIFPSVFVSRDVSLCIKYIMRDNRLSPSGSQKKNWNVGRGGLKSYRYINNFYYFETRGIVRSCCANLLTEPV